MKNLLIEKFIEILIKRHRIWVCPLLGSHQVKLWAF